MVPSVKPAGRHNKAGNIKNVLFRVSIQNKIFLFVDDDMRATERLLLYPQYIGGLDFLATHPTYHGKTM